ncbi:hypothetical protein ACO0OL_003787 [Hanseniaspora opuntiae]|jgi:Gly-Xaa carboxypeptidase
MTYGTISATDAIKKLNKKKTGSIVVGAAVAAAVLLTAGKFLKSNSADALPAYTNDCGKYAPIDLAFDKSYSKIFNDKDFQAELIEKFQNIIRIPTEVYDDYGQPDLSVPLEEEPIYGKFAPLHDYLEKAFPLVHSTLKKELINGVGLVYTWAPKNTKGKKPLLLMAHQDVVPVNVDTLDRWTYPPFDGVYEPETGKIYGRGSADTKPLIIAQLAATELLIEDGFELERPLILAYGFDEEKGGSFGAKFIAEHLKERYGKNGIEVVLDEGNGVLDLGNGTFFAQPATSEKGYVDIEITLNTLGGHSSAPNHWPDKEMTGISLMSEINYFISENQFPVEIDLKNPAVDTLQCFSKYGLEHESVDPKLVNAISKGSISNLRDSLEGTAMKYIFKTTEAMDIFKGGVKANAMPEQVVNLINHRINTQSSVGETVDHDLSVVLATAEKYDLGVTLEWTNGTAPTVYREDSANGGFIVKVINPLEPVTASPADGVWDLIANTTSFVYSDDYLTEGKDGKFYFEGSISTGNTDTKYYFNNEMVNNRIYRYSGGLLKMDNFHTVDEWTSDKALFSSTAFMYAFIGNFNAHIDEII